MGRFPKLAISALGVVGVAVLATLLYSVLKGPAAPPRTDKAAERSERDPRAQSSEPPSLSVAPSVPPNGQFAPPVKRADAKKTPAAAADPPRAVVPTDANAAPARVPTEPLSAQEVFKLCSPAVVRVVVRDKAFSVIGQASGFFVSADGILVTNHHVIEKAHFASVVLPNGASLFVDGVAAADPNGDLALLKVNGTGLDFLQLSPRAPPVGARVYAVGNPSGLTNTLSEGLVSALRRTGGLLDAIQTTAAISPGSSGGPLIADDGLVVGVTTASIKGGQNLNFAIPAAKVRALVARRGKLQTLASTGGLRMEKEATDKLNAAFRAIARKDWKEATRILTELRETQRDNPSVWYALGELHRRLGNHEIAIQHYTFAISLKPDFARAYISMAWAYEKLGRYAEALAACQKGIAIDPNDAFAYSCMGDAYGNLGRYAEALAAYQKAIAIDPNNALAYFRMGLAYGKLGRDAEAIAAYQKAVAIDPHAYSAVGVAYENLGRYAEALAAYQKAVAIDPNSVLAYFGMAFAYGKLGRDAEAIAAYQKAVAIDPNNALVYRGMGSAYFALGRYAEAIGAYRKAVAISPDKAAYFGMGSAYVELGRYAEAIGAFQKAVAIDPHYAFAYFSMGLAYEKLGRYAEAIAAYQKAIAIDPNNALAYFSMGVACEELRHRAEAIAAYGECLRLEPNGSLAADARAAIARLRPRSR